MLPMPMAPIEQALHIINAQDAANEAAIDTYARAGRTPPRALIDRRERLQSERRRLTAWH